jgi:hypothetical protein
MKISGFTIIKNAVISDYPVVESISSILPLVDEMVVLVGDCQDETEALIRSIPSDKIKIHHSVWNQNLRSGGEVLADETNKAFQLIDPASSWAFYIQADEVVHERYHAAIMEACKRYEAKKEVQGLLFNYLHFYGTYSFIGDSRRWYDHEVRIIRNNKCISAYRDAQGFRIGHKKLLVKAIDASIYHYGWVKSPEQMKKKMKETSKYWLANPEEWQQFLASEDAFDFSQIDSLEKFKETHPKVMQARVDRQNWEVTFNPGAKHFSFKNRLLYRFEKMTGIRPFAFKNYVRMR